MSAEPDAADLTTVGAHFRLRRERLDMTQDELAAEAGVNRDTVSAIESGKGSAKTRRKVDEALTRAEDEARLQPMPAEPEPTEAEPEPSPHFIRFKVEGVYGARALVVEAPVENLAELEEMVDRIMRRLQSEQQ
jgi:DNA-binding XRE family transcriptional regulator